MIELTRDLAGGDHITLGSLQMRLPDSQHISLYNTLYCDCWLRGGGDFEFKLRVYHPGVFTELNNMVLSVKHTFILYFMHCLGCTQHWKPGTTFIPTTST